MINNDGLCAAERETEAGKGWREGRRWGGGGGIKGEGEAPLRRWDMSKDSKEVRGESKGFQGQGSAAGECSREEQAGFQVERRRRRRNPRAYRGPCSQDHGAPAAVTAEAQRRNPPPCLRPTLLTLALGFCSRPFPHLGLAWSWPRPIPPPFGLLIVGLYSNPTSPNTPSHGRLVPQLHPLKPPCLPHTPGLTSPQRSIIKSIISSLGSSHLRQVFALCQALSWVPAPRRTGPTRSRSSGRQP